MKRLSRWQIFEQERQAELAAQRERTPASAGEELTAEDAEAYPVGSPKWLAAMEADVDALCDRMRGE